MIEDGKLARGDPSVGAVACARVINPAANIEYLTADDKGLATIADASE